MRPVEILARVRREEGREPLSGQTARPAESFKWIYLSAGEVRDGLDLVIGIMASYVSNQPTQSRLGKETVLLPLNEELPKAYFGLFELENSTIPD